MTLCDPRRLDAHQVQTLPSSGCPWYCTPLYFNKLIKHLLL